MNTVLCFALLMCVCLAYALALSYPDEMFAQPEGLQAEESRYGGWGGNNWGHGGGGWGYGGGWGQGGGYGRGGGWGHNGGWGHHG